MTNREAVRLIRNLPTMCEFTDAYGEPIDSDAYYEAVDIAISALHAQDAPDINVGSMISRQTAKPRYIDANEIPYCEVLDADTHKGTGRFMADKKDIDALPSARPYTDEEIQKMQDLEQAQLDKAYELGRQFAQPERLTDDDFETIRIHLNAYKEKLCNQQRWKEADEYQRIIDRFMAFASAQPEISQEYAKAVFAWLLDYQIKVAELKGRYTPYEVLSWVVNDWRKENR